MKYPSDDNYTAVQRHPDDPFGDEPVPPFPQEPASPEVVKQAAETIRGKLDSLRRGAHPESANGQLYNIALDLLRQRDALADALESAVATGFLEQIADGWKLRSMIHDALTGAGREWPRWPTAGLPKEGS